MPVKTSLLTTTIRPGVADRRRAGPGSCSVSVIIPVYNGAATIESAIRSALGQTMPVLEVIVVDDGSTDGTSEIVARIKGPITLFRQVNAGPASARNLGARHARGKWLALLDADDWWAPNKLERQMPEARTSGVGVIHCLSNASAPRTPGSIGFQDLWEQNWICNSSVLVRRTLFLSVGGMDERLRNTQDYHLWLRLAGLGQRIVLIPEVLVFYRRDAGISSNPESLFRGLDQNIRSIQNEFAVAAEMVRRKRIRMLREAGASALFKRKLPFARSVLRELVLLSPTPRHLMFLAAAHLPLPILEARRKLLAARTPDAPVSSVVRASKPARLSPVDARPRVVVVIDAEEEFDWQTLPSVSGPVRNMREQWRAQRIFDRFGVVPTYAVDYAVASQPEGYEPLLGLLSAGRCEVGAHLHPWNTPPILDQPNEVNSCAGNLPAIVEREKLRALTQLVQRNLRAHPVLYRGGRNGSGSSTAENLVTLGYKIDSSVLPHHDLRHEHGPDYRGASPQPYWCAAEPSLLELPPTVALTGRLSRLAPHIAFARLSQRLRLPAVLSRGGLLDRTRLTPEGVSLDEAKHMTRVAHRRDGQQVFTVTYHSSSLLPGSTPFVRNKQDLRRFLEWIEGYLGFFIGEMGGLPSTPSAIYRMAERS